MFMQGGVHKGTLEVCCFPTSVLAESGSMGLSQPSAGWHPRISYLI